MRTTSGAPGSTSAIPASGTSGQAGSGAGQGTPQPLIVEPTGPNPPSLGVAEHQLAVSALDRVAPPIDDSGLVLGVDVETVPVSIRLFRDRSTRVTLIGGLWAARVILLRVLALGAYIVIQSQRPAAWQGWGQWATGTDDRVVLMPPTEPVMVTGTPSAPGLIVNDTGLAPRAAVPGLGAWQTQLTILPELTQYGVPSIHEADLVMMQSLSPREAMVGGNALRLTAETANLLQAMHEDMLALLGASADSYLWVNPTTIEREAFGPPRRAD